MFELPTQHAAHTCSDRPPSPHTGWNPIRRSAVDGEDGHSPVTTRPSTGPGSPCPLPERAGEAGERLRLCSPRSSRARLGHGLDGLCSPQLTGDGATARHAAPAICSCAGRPGGPTPAPRPPHAPGALGIGGCPRARVAPPRPSAGRLSPPRWPQRRRVAAGGQGALTRALIAAATCGGSSEPRARVDGSVAPSPAVQPEGSCGKSCGRCVSMAAGGFGRRAARQGTVTKDL